MSQQRGAERGYARRPVERAQPVAGSVDNHCIDMSRSLPTHPGCIQHRSFRFATVVLAVLWLLAAFGCGEVTCPKPLGNVDGTCQEVERITTEGPKPGVERCDGKDNDGDTEVDENWPELGEACGEGTGECVEGEYVCADDGMGIVCEGAAGPSDEVCDGKDNDCDGTADNGPEETCDGEDNDCDGLVDEGVWSVKEEPVFDDLASVAAVDGGFVVTRRVGERIFAETYDERGLKTGLDDQTPYYGANLDFLESDGFGREVLVSLGVWRADTMAIEVDHSLAPFIIEKQTLHEDWDKQGVLSFSTPPFYPRVDASVRRVVGMLGSLDFGVITTGPSDIRGFLSSPTVVPGLDFVDGFASDGPYIVWPDDENLRAAFLLDDGRLVQEIDIGRGASPSVSIAPPGLGVAWISGDEIGLSVLHALSLQCAGEPLCNSSVSEDQLLDAAHGPTGLVYHEASSSWVVVANRQIVVVGAGPSGIAVKQVEQRGDAPFPNRIDAVVSGQTIAVMQSSLWGQSALTFLGCL